MKKLLLTLTASLAIMGASAQTLQRTWDAGRVSVRNDDNTILQRSSAGAGGLFLQFKNADSSVRGAMGYNAVGVNNFYIYNADNSPIFLQSRTVVNNPTDDGKSGLQVKSGLAVYGSANNLGNHIRFKRSDNLEMAYIGWENDSLVNSRFLIKSSNGNDILFRINSTDIMNLSYAGGVGIGTNVPQTKLDVRGHLLLDGGVDPIIYTSSATTDQYRYLRLANSPAVGTASGLKTGGILVADDYLYANPTRNNMVVKGTVSIGAVSPGPYQLAVEGTIAARRIKVTQVKPWADFVFDEEYELPVLTETADFIRQHKHLPGIPSAAEVAKEGIDVGEMNSKLLQKIEELTLHLIEQNERMMVLEKEVKELSKKK